jgi:hypothetical protein
MSAFHPLRTLGAVASSSDSGMKKCPACAELIQDEAVKCKHCGTVLRRNHGFPQIGCVGGGILFIVAALAYNAVVGDSQSSSNTAASTDTAAEPVRTWRSVATVAQARIAARDLINDAGYDCAAVTSLSPIGSIESGGTVHRANCSNGDQYAVILSEDNRIRFLSSCAVFLSSTGHHC